MKQKNLKLGNYKLKQNPPTVLKRQQLMKKIMIMEIIMIYLTQNVI